MKAFLGLLRYLFYGSCSMANRKCVNCGSDMVKLCTAVGCEREIYKGIMCRKHWSKVPQVNRDEILDAWIPDSTAESEITRPRRYAYFMSVIRATNSVAIMEDLLTFEEALDREERAKENFITRHGGTD